MIPSRMHLRKHDVVGNVSPTPHTTPPTRTALSLRLCTCVEAIRWDETLSNVKSEFVYSSLFIHKGVFSRKLTWLVRIVSWLDLCELYLASYMLHTHFILHIAWYSIYISYTRCCTYIVCVTCCRHISYCILHTHDILHDILHIAYTNVGWHTNITHNTRNTHNTHITRITHITHITHVTHITHITHNTHNIQTSTSNLQRLVSMCIKTPSVTSRCNSLTLLLVSLFFWMGVFVLPPLPLFCMSVLCICI